MTALEIALAKAETQATDRALRERGDSITVYVDGSTVLVRGPHDPGELPKTARVHCIAQWWGESKRKRADGTAYETVQIRRDGAISEWISQ